MAARPNDIIREEKTITFTGPDKLFSDLASQMTNWTWVAPVGGGANAGLDPHSGRYKLKLSALAKQKLAQIPDANHKEILGPLQRNIEAIEQKNEKNLNQLKRDIADLKISKEKANTTKAIAITNEIAKKVAEKERLELEIKQVEDKFNKTIDELKALSTERLIELESLRNRIVFFKREGDVAKNISEVVAGQLSRLFIPENAESFAEVRFARSPSNEVYVASIGVTGSPEDLYKDAYKAFREHHAFDEIKNLDQDKRKKVKVPEDRPKLAGSLNKYIPHFVISQGRYIGLDQMYAMAIFLDDPDLHYANIMVTLPAKVSEERRYTEAWKLPVRRIDYAASLGGPIRSFDSEVHYDDILRYFPGIDPTNHVRELPSLLKISKDFIVQLEGLARISEEKITHDVTRVLGNIINDVDPTGLQRFAKRIGASKEFDLSFRAMQRYAGKLSSSSDSTDAKQFQQFAKEIGFSENMDSALKKFADTINTPNSEKSEEFNKINNILIAYKLRGFFKQKLMGRQLSMKKLALEIKLSLCFERLHPFAKTAKSGLKVAKGGAEYYNLITTIAENYDFFKDRVTFNFRGKWPEYYKDELTYITKQVTERLTVLKQALDFELTNIPMEAKTLDKVDLTAETDLFKKLKVKLDALTTAQDPFALELTRIQLKFQKFRENCLAIIDKLPPGEDRLKLIYLYNSQLYQFNKLCDSMTPKELFAFEERLASSTVVKALEELNTSYNLTTKKNVLDRTYNRDGHYGSWLEGFFGWPNSWFKDDDSIPLKGFKGFFACLKCLFTISLNTVKVFTELLPNALARASREGFSLCENYLKSSNKSLGGVLAAGFGWGVFGVLTLGLELVRLVGKRITSPIRSFKEAYKYGVEKSGNKWLGALLAGSSAIVSVAATAAALLVAPIGVGYFFPEAGVALGSAITTMGSWMIAHVPGIKAAAALGGAFSASASVAASVIAAKALSLTINLLTFCFGGAAAAVKKYKEPKKEIVSGGAISGTEIAGPEPDAIVENLSVEEIKPPVIGTPTSQITEQLTASSNDPQFSSNVSTSAPAPDAPANNQQQPEVSSNHAPPPGESKRPKVKR